MDRDALKALAIDLRSRDGDHWTLEKVGETLGVDPSTVRMTGKDGCLRTIQVLRTQHLPSPSG
jgi:hypothetical protein